MNDGRPYTDEELAEADARSAVLVEEIFNQLLEQGAQLCNFEFYSRNIPPLQAYYGHGPVWEALRRYEGVLLRRTADQICDLRRNAAQLEREGR
jgi:hypothetical protein